MPKAKDREEAYEVVDDDWELPKPVSVEASFITKANALIEEYETFKREMRTADRRMQQHRDRVKRSKEKRSNDDLVYSRLMMMYEGAKRMMCNRVRLLANMGVTLPDFRDGVASLPDTIMTEGPFDTVPCGDAAEEKRIAHKKEQRRALNLSDEADDLTPQDTSDLDEALDEEPGLSQKQVSSALDRLIEQKRQRYASGGVAGPPRPILMGLDLATVEQNVLSRYAAGDLDIVNAALGVGRNTMTPNNPNETTVGGIRIVTNPALPESVIAAMREVTGGVSPSPASNEPESASILRAAGMHHSTVSGRVASTSPDLHNLPKAGAEKKSAKSRNKPIRTSPPFTSDEDEDF